MEREIPIVGEFYKNNDGNLCQIRAIALNYGDLKRMAVYQVMSPPFDIFVMPLDDFLSSVSEKNDIVSGKESVKVKETLESVTDSEFREALLSGKLERNIHGRITEEEIARRGFLELLDARNCHEKREFLVALKPYLTRRMLENFAVTLDLVLEEGDDDECFNTILSCIKTMEKYEGGHLRGE